MLSIHPGPFTIRSPANPLDELFSSSDALELDYRIAVTCEGRLGVESSRPNAASREVALGLRRTLGFSAPPMRVGQEQSVIVRF